MVPPRFDFHLLLLLLWHAFEVQASTNNIAYTFTRAEYIIHEVPEFYEADKVTLKASSGKLPLRMITNRPESGGAGNAMGRILPMLKQAVRGVNRNPQILPNHIVELWFIDSGCAPQVAVQNTLTFINSKPKGFFHMLFGPMCSGPTAALNDVAQSYHLFQL